MPTAAATLDTHTVRQQWRVGALLGLSVPVLLWVAQMTPLAQPLDYHDFADQRWLLGLPHFWNVLSNLPFTLVGLIGCAWLMRVGQRSDAFATAAERNAYFVFFVGEVLTGYGSGYYHAAPSNETLVLDRLGLSLMLTSFFAIVVSEFVSLRWGRLLLAPVCVLGQCAVHYWSWTEAVGRGDLRPYLLVQFYPILAIPFIILVFRSRYTLSGTLLLTWALYGLAKACEFYDAPLYELTDVWSGHTLKHLVAAVGSYLPLYSLQRRSLRNSGQHPEDAASAPNPIL